jgi:DNA polymerase IV
MDLQINDIRPLTMHIDLNSCYAIIEQQANPLIRHKPVGVAAYTSPGGFIIASSYEAKRKGINLIRVRDARAIDRNVIILPPDPEKYFDAHRRFRKVLERYTSELAAKSIDEFVVDFKGSIAVQQGRSLVSIGHQIKRDIRAELGEYVTVNIGIAPNRFLAKVAAGLHKPDGLDVITGKDIRQAYSELTLLDLPGINYRYKARLNLAGIFTPLQFLDAPMRKLKGEVFNSIVGYYWYLRLRGYEIDSVQFGTKSFGNDYSVGKKTADKEEVSKLLMKLSEKTGRRMRKHAYQADGAFLGLGFENHTWWGKGRRSKRPLYATQDIYRHIIRLLQQVTFPTRVTHINIAVTNLKPDNLVQLELFDDSIVKSRALTKAADTINNRYGEFTVVPAVMANMNDVIIKRVPFGSVRDI